MAGRPKLYPIEVSQKDDPAAYTREWRKHNRAAAEYNRAASAAHRRALTRLAHAHPDEFEHFLNVERGLAGLPAAGPNGRRQFDAKAHLYDGGGS